MSRLASGTFINLHPSVLHAVFISRTPCGKCVGLLTVEGQSGDSSAPQPRTALEPPGFLDFPSALLGR